MSEINNSSYQDKVVSKKIEPLSDFLNTVQVRRGGVKQVFDPYVRDRENKTASLNSLLTNLQEARSDDVMPSGGKDLGDVIEGLYLGPNQRYFMGASSEPPMVITTKVTDEKVHYYLFPYRKEQVLKKDIAADLFLTGSKNWLRDPKSRKDPDLRNSIKSVVNGNPGEKISLDDYQFSNVQVKYTGPKEGDLEPWKDLESMFDVRVDSVLTNKQVYNLRLNNRELDSFNTDIRKKKPRVFKIVKIISEEREYMIEAAAQGAPKLKMVRHKVDPKQKREWGELLNMNQANKFAAEDFIAGQTVYYDKATWFIVDFAPSGEDMTAILLGTDFDEVAQFVPLQDLKAYTPAEMGPDDDEIPDPERVRPEDAVRPPDMDQKDKPKNWAGGQAEGLPVDKKPKDKELKFPESNKDGKTQEQKALKEEVVPTGKVRQLIQCIDRDPVLGGKEGRFKVIVDNLLRKRKEGVYEPNLATKAFETLADMGARKCVKNPKLADASFPRSIRLKAAEALRERFEQEVQLGNLKEMKSTDSVIDEHIKNLIESTEDVVKEAVEKEAVPFTEREVEELKKFENVDVSKENVATFDWNSGGKNYKVEITKKPRPQTNDIVYSAVSTFNNNQLDRERTVDSDPFKTEDDPTILNDFLTKLNLSEAINEADEKSKCPDTTGEADKKGLAPKDVHPEQLAMGVKVEMEHTKDKKLAKQIALDHLAEMPDYYTKLAKMEREGGVKEESTVTKDVQKGMFEDRDLEAKVVSWLKENPNPKDDEVHAFSKELKVSPHDLEAVFYKIASEVAKKKEEVTTEEMTSKGPERGENQSLPEYMKDLKEFFKGALDYKVSGNKLTVDFRYNYWSSKEAEKNFRAMMKGKGVTEEPTKVDVKPDGFFGNVVAEYDVNTDEEVVSEEEKKPAKKKAKKKETKHTQTKLVNSLPIRDGKKVRTEVVGDTRIVYRTFEEKRKSDAEKEKKRKVEKGD